MKEFVHAKLEIEETAATIAAERHLIDYAVDAIKAARLDVERQIRKDDFFLTTLEPYVPAAGCSTTVSRMCEASRLAGVGPMATVAGVIAQAALEAMVLHGCTHGWVDNGGDIALILEEPITVEVFSEPGSKNAVGLSLEPSSGVVGLCTSSARLGHSISFGDADASVIMAKDAVLADALATAVGNRVKDSKSLRSCFDDFEHLDGLLAGLVMRDGDVAMYGRLPRIVNVEHNAERITAHSKMSTSSYLGDVKADSGVET